MYENWLIHTSGAAAVARGRTEPYTARRKVPLRSKPQLFTSQHASSAPSFCGAVALTSSFQPYEYVPPPYELPPYEPPPYEPYELPPAYESYESYESYPPAQSPHWHGPRSRLHTWPAFVAKFSVM